MRTECALDRDAKLAHLTALHHARRAYFQAVYGAELKWQLHVYAVDLATNGHGGVFNTETTYAQAEKARNDIRAREQAVTALCAQARALGLDLGIDHAIEKQAAGE